MEKGLAYRVPVQALRNFRFCFKNQKKGRLLAPSLTGKFFSLNYGATRYLPTNLPDRVLNLKNVPLGTGIIFVGMLPLK